MNIAVYHNLPSGGGKRALREMILHLAQRHTVDVYTLSTAEHDFCDLRSFAGKHQVFTFKPLGLTRRPFGRLNQGIRAIDLFRLRSLQQKIASQIDRSGYDVVFVHNCQFGQSPALLQFLRTPSVYYCQEPPRQVYEPMAKRPYSQLSPVQRLGNRLDPLPNVFRKTLVNMDRDNARAASLVLVNSQYSRETLYHIYGIFAQVGRLGVDTELFRPLGSEEGSGVVSIGALSPKKGFDFLIKSVSLIEASQRPALTIVCNWADMREQDYLVNLANELEVTMNIRIGISDRELVKAYNLAKITLYAPVMEPFGLVPLESMASGTPVIGICEAGVRETIIHGRTGLLIARSTSLFARAIEGLLDDREAMARFGRNGRELTVRDWSWQDSARQIEAYLVQTAHMQS